MQTVHASNHFEVFKGTAVIPFRYPELLETLSIVGLFWPKERRRRWTRKAGSKEKIANQVNYVAHFFRKL